MASTATLTVRILGDSDDAVKALAEVEVSIENAEKTTKKSGKKMGGVWAAVAAAMAMCVKSAAQLEQATGALNTIFGDQADEMLDWAEGMAQYGLSTAQAAGASALLGAQMKNTGLTTEQMTVATQALVETSTQLAAVMGGSAVDAAAAMGAAMRGEFDTLERYGISLTADAVATEAARLASEGFTAASEQQAKMVATLSLIQQQATIILGEGEEQTLTARTATDHFMASITNLAAAIGGPLLNALAPLIEALADTADRMVVAAEESDILRVAGDLLSQVLEDVADILDPVLNTALDLVSDLMDKLAGLIEEYVMPILDRLAGVLDTVADALDTVIGWVQEAVEWFDNFTDSVHEAIDALTFWNDTYDPNAASSQALNSTGAAMVGTHGARAGQSVTINVYADASDPYALARLLTRQLERYAVVQGRRAGAPLAGAW